METEWSGRLRLNLLKNRRQTAFMFVAVAGMLSVLFFFDPVQYRFYPVCLFHEMTGWHCPGCGSLRALHALVHGDWTTAIGLNPLLMVTLPILGVIMVKRWWQRSTSSGLERMRPVWVWAILGVVLGFGILRNVPMGLFGWMAP